MQRPLRLTLILVFFASIAHGKLALVKDLPSITESEHFEIKVSADGHSKVTRDTVIRINNDQGRESQSVQTLTYNSRSQKFKLLEAATINGSGHSPTDKVVVTPVPKADVEIKETGELSQAFDSIKQVAISYPKVKIGSRIHLRYVIESNEIPSKGFDTKLT